MVDTELVYGVASASTVAEAMDEATNQLGKHLPRGHRFVSVDHTTNIISGAKTVEPTIVASAFGGKAREVADSAVVVSMVAVTEEIA